MAEVGAFGDIPAPKASTPVTCGSRGVCMPHRQTNACYDGPAVIELRSDIDFRDYRPSTLREDQDLQKDRHELLPRPTSDRGQVILAHPG